MMDMEVDKVADMIVETEVDMVTEMVVKIPIEEIIWNNSYPRKWEQRYKIINSNAQCAMNLYRVMHLSLTYFRKKSAMEKFDWQREAISAMSRDGKTDRNLKVKKVLSLEIVILKKR